MTPSCRSCGAPILWARSTRGRMVPLDREPVADGTIILGADDVAFVLGPAGYHSHFATGTIILGADDVAFVLGPADEPIAGTPRYHSHFATCPDADKYRRH